MDGADYLYACVEAGVAISGFSALVIALRGREPVALAEYERRTVVRLVERGLMAAFLSLLPILLSGLGLPNHLVWFTSSGMLALYGLYSAIKTWRARRLADQIVPAPLFYLLTVVGLVVIGIQVLNAFDLGLAQSVWWYLVGVTWLLASAGYAFMFVLRAWARVA